MVRITEPGYYPDDERERRLAAIKRGLQVSTDPRSDLGAAPASPATQAALGVAPLGGSQQAALGVLPPDPQEKQMLGAAPAASAAQRALGLVTDTPTAQPSSTGFRPSVDQVGQMQRELAATAAKNAAQGGSVGAPPT